MRASDGPAARVAPDGPDAWHVWWEDFRLDGSADFDDLVVRIEVLPDCMAGGAKRAAEDGVVAEAREGVDLPGSGRAPGSGADGGGGSMGPPDATVQGGTAVPFYERGAVPSHS